jgi:hypothetical protein
MCLRVREGEGENLIVYNLFQYILIRIGTLACIYIICICSYVYLPMVLEKSCLSFSSIPAIWCLDGDNHLGFLRILKDYPVWLHLSKGNLYACGFLDSPLPFARNVYSLLERWESTSFFFI